jgi:pimeloyl-ACP methyl ester carboxylesterase
LYDPSGWLSRFSADRLFVRYDGRGFGLSDRDVSDFSLDARVSDLTAVIEALELERFDLYAVSAGGPTAVAYADAHPEQVAHLVLAGSGITGFADDPMGLQILGMLPMFSAGWQSPVVRRMFTLWITPGADAVTQEVVSEFLRVSSDGPSVEGFLGSFFKTDAREQAKRLRVPTLVIHGTDDKVIPLSLGRLAASTIPGARFEIIEAANHFEGTIGSVRVHELIEDFLRQ